MNKYLVSLAVGLSVFYCSPAAADVDWPSQPIRWIVPYSPGGSTDVLARLLAKELESQLKQTIVVENKEGAGGNIGTQYVASAKPDGYTWIMGNVGPISINPSLYRNLSFDPQKDLAPVSLLMKVPNLIVANPSFAPSTGKEVIQYAKAHAEAPLNFATPGTGTSLHLAGELFASQADIAMTQIPYKGSSPGLVAVMGDQVPIMFDNMPSALPLVQSGKLKAIAITSKTRSALLPDVPTVDESCIPGYDVTGWFGVLVPRDTPPAIVHKLSAVFRTVLADPAVRQRIESLGGMVPETGPDAFRRFIRDETNKWASLIKSSNLTLN